MHSVLSEAALQAEIQGRLHVRDALGVSFSEEETRLINQWFGNETAGKHALVNGVEPRLMRMAVLVALEEAVALVKDKLPPIDGHMPPTYADMLSSGKVPSFNISPLPSGPGMPSNTEVEANFERTRARAMEKNVMHVRNSARQSPFGKLASFAALDELSPVTLSQLFSSLDLRPDVVLNLRVVVPAYVAACATAVVEDDAGQRIRLNVYNSQVADEAGARALLPLGARFALKAPFLKRQNDGWLGLRVDYPVRDAFFFTVHHKLRI